jgi:hypothetical protein
MNLLSGVSFEYREAARRGQHQMATVQVRDVVHEHIIVDDPSGNPIELFEPTLAAARLSSRRP